MDGSRIGAGIQCLVDLNLFNKKIFRRSKWLSFNTGFQPQQPNVFRILPGAVIDLQAIVRGEDNNTTGEQNRTDDYLR